MLPLLGAAALVLVAGTSWGSASPAGREALKSPQNVNVSIIDDNITLTWERSPEHDRNVTYSLCYQIPFETDWTELPTCQHITASECTFSAGALNNIYEDVQLRIRAERGNDASAWYEVDSFVPYLEAQIGPPELRLEAEDKAIKINLSPPGTENSIMWATDLLAFKYNIVIWDNSSMEQSTEFNYPRYNIYNLSPNTTYCLKIRAVLYLQRKVGLYTPVHCINTTAENKLPPPEHLQVSAHREFYFLSWDYPGDPSEQVIFRAQWLSAYLKMHPGSHADKWKQIQDCENVKTTQCVIPQAVFMNGIHFIRVQASKGNATSFWSEEKKFDTTMQTVILPPVVKMKSSNDGSLHVYIGSANDPEDKPMDQDYRLIYEIIFWENSSKVEKTYREKTDFTISHLKVLTVYCVKARALVVDEKWNKSSVFSDIFCEETKPGSTSKNALIGGISFILFLFPAAIYLVKHLWKKICYVFFASNKPPSTLNEDFSGKSLTNLLFITSEEQTERCCIIENTNTVTVIEDIPTVEENHKQYSSQTSEDSGNYSNEEENRASDQE